MTYLLTMRRCTLLPALAGLAGLAVAVSAPAALGAEPSLGDMFERLLPPGLQPKAGADRPAAGRRESSDASAVSPAPAEPRSAAKPADPEPARSRADMLDDLFARLGRASDPEEAKGIAGLIQHIWMQSGSDTAHLLMTRAQTALSADKRDLALKLLDKIIAIDPTWAEAWNKRATLRYMDHDDMGSMADIGHVLALEPRHFGALSGMGYILVRNGMKKEALTVLRRALEIDPADGDLKKSVESLVPDVEGRPI